MHGAGKDVTDSWNGNKQGTELDLFSLRGGLEFLDLKALRVTFFHDEEQREGESLTNKHDRGLHVGVEEVFVVASLIDHLLVLKL